ncbi:MAG: UDP-N-acetylglucosamine 1-carboxyvinyltransferase, partial [Phycisphaerae bacterium]|nr:UDP-N-acetylglucosamine 1-carboxyvinyltransferase [Phycisphaerae bacterium]
MDAFSIHGGQRLSGTISVDGSKNASLPLLATALLTEEELVFEGIPNLSDIANMVRLLEELGCTSSRTKSHIQIQTKDSSVSHARYDIVRTMRASVCVLGPLLAKRGEVRVSMPGGCSFGDRPIDLHLRGLEALGAKIHLEGGDIVARCDRLHGATIFLGGPFGSTVLGTANVMSAATLAKGTTIIESAACEPEITDLAVLLNNMGAKITGA